MHTSAKESGRNFALKYCKDLAKDSVVVDVGSYSVNGSVKEYFKDYKYVGIDIAAGPNVDIVTELGKIPFEDSVVDVVISTSCFEHDEFFWETFIEMCRVLKPGGYIYINAPSKGYYHAHPVDCWRFYKDSWPALAKYAVKKGYQVTCLENRVDTSSVSPEWGDSVGIFTKK